MADTNNMQDDNFVDNMFKEFSDSASGVIALAKSVTGIAQAGAANVQANKVAGDQAYSQEQGAFIKAGQDAQDINTINGQAVINKANDDSIVATSGGTTAAQMADRNVKIKSLQDSIISRAETLKEAAGTSIFNDPVKWLTNQFTVPFVSDKQDAEIAEYKEMNQFTEDDQKRSTAQFAIDTTLNVAKGQKLIDAQNDLALQDSIVKSADSKQKMAQFDNSAVAAATSMSIAGFDQQYKQMQIAGETQARAIQALSFDATNPGKLATSTMKEYREQGMEAQIKDVTDLNSFTNGASPSNPGAYDKQPIKIKAAMDNIMSSMKTIGAYGQNPIDAYNNTQAAGVPPGTAGEKLTKDYIGKTIAQVESDNREWKSFPAGVQFDKINTALKNKMSNDLSDVSKPGSVYSTPSLATAVKLPMIAVTDIGQAMLPMANNPNYTVNGNDLMATANKLIDDGKLDPGKAAAQIVQIGKTLQAATNAAGSFKKFGIPQFGSGPASGYKMSVEDQSSLSSGMKSIDMINQAQVESFLTRQAIQRNFDKNKSQYLISPVGVGAQ